MPATTAQLPARQLSWRGSISCSELPVPPALPGHGAAIRPAAKVINTIARFIDRRLSRLTRLLGAGPRSAAEVLQAFFPAIDELERCHAVAEVVLLIEVLEARGAVIREDDRGVFRYRLT